LQSFAHPSLRIALKPSKKSGFDCASNGRNSAAKISGYRRVQMETRALRKRSRAGSESAPDSQLTCRGGARLGPLPRLSEGARSVSKSLDALNRRIRQTTVSEI
jgi:hypothetical protein